MSELNPHFLYLVPLTTFIWTISTGIFLLRSHFPGQRVIRCLLAVLNAFFLLVLMLAIVVIVGNSYSGLGDFLQSAWTEAGTFQFDFLSSERLKLATIAAEILSPATLLFGAIAVIAGFRSKAPRPRSG